MLATGAEFKRLILRAILLPILLLAILAALVLTQAGRLTKEVTDAEHSDRVLAEAYQTQKLMLDLETGLRGYVVTHDREFLDPFRSAQAAIGPELERLKALVADRPGQSARVAEITRLLAEWMQLARAEVGGVPPAADASLGIRDMQRIRTEISSIVASAQARRLESAARVRRLGTTLLYGGIGLAIFLGVVLAFAARTQLFELSETYEGATRELQRSHAELERRVRERTRELEVFRLLVRSVKDYAIYLLDADGRVMSWSRAAEQMMGYSTEEIVGRSFEGFFTEADRRAGHPRAELRQALDKGRYDEDGIRVRKDGSVFTANVLVTPLYDEDGSLRGFAKVTRDVTRQKKAQEALDRAHHELTAANRELEAFSYSVSHDLRAPLRAIDGFSQAILEDFGERLDPVAQGYLERIRAGVQRMGVLIDDLLKLSRITRIEMRSEPVDLAELARGIATDLRARDPRREVAVEIEPELQARGDRGLLSVALENLLSNAWKFTSKVPHPRIEVGCEVRDGKPVYFVRDNGAGFDMAHSDKLFGAFQRLHSANEFPGTGIGLATVRRVVNRHGGEIWAESAPGRGATFYFTLGEGPAGAARAA